jgi:glycosyltransferase involved in cell wall biosynthesis
MKSLNKILWVADYSVKEHKGGAQQTNKIMIDYGREQGYDIELCLGGSVINSKGDYNVVIINNITKWDRSVIDELVDSQNVVRYEHDYWVAENYPELFKKVKHTIFLSPLHYKTACKKVGYEIENYSLVPPSVDTKIFKPKGEKKHNTVLWAGNFCDEKGSENYMEFARNNPNLKFYVAGWGKDIPEIEKIDNMEYLGELTKKELIKEYQRCQYFYHKPEKYNEPFGRTIIESYYCGCSLLINGNIGAISWDWDYSNYEQIKKSTQSQSKFWKIIKNEI